VRARARAREQECERRHSEKKTTAVRPLEAAAKSGVAFMTLTWSVSAPFSIRTFTKSRSPVSAATISGDAPVGACRLTLAFCEEVVAE
jgi:hypothetical protein